MANPPDKQPWLVSVHYRMRSAAFAMLFVAICLHIAGKDYSLVAWLLLGILFLIYPHVQYWRSCRAENPVNAEMNNLVVDSLLVGFVVAAIEFPLWIAFSAMLGVFTDNAANKGLRGVWETMIALPLGALIWVAVFGFKISSHTDWPVTLFCILGLTGYLLAVSNIGYARNVQLRLTREKLKLRENELLASNETLLKNLNQIDELRQQLHEQANRDPLTGLYNRRYLDSTLEREIARCKREGHPLSLIMIDIDHFKKINDTYGHLAGDEILISLGKILGGMARAGDVACRYGGEEFLVIMPNMSLDACLERAEELRVTFGHMVVAFGDFRLQVTLSIGIAVYPGHGISADELISCADRALYQAKHKGRNRVEVQAVDRDDVSIAMSDIVRKNN